MRSLNSRRRERSFADRFWRRCARAASASVAVSTETDTIRGAPAMLTWAMSASQSERTGVPCELVAELVDVAVVAGTAAGDAVVEGEEADAARSGDNEEEAGGSGGGLEAGSGGAVAAVVDGATLAFADSAELSLRYTSNEKVRRTTNTRLDVRSIVMRERKPARIISFEIGALGAGGGGTLEGGGVGRWVDDFGSTGGGGGTVASVGA